ncbi:unnamed protein product [Linum trigynum]|uniref:Uncharacterized protein n=1 Tax=Linum trigynum TaxID=586398 RepID=A0AAV2FZC9_9ROSI
MDGFRWKVGNGKLIRIWDDEWIPGKSFFYPDPVPANEFPDDLVSSIIDQQQGTWDSEKVERLFSAQYRVLISKIPLSSPPKEDSRIWKDSVSGSYTVKSAYFWIRNKQQSKIDLSHGSGEDNSEFWQNLWSPPTQPKVKNFLWKLCKNILPVGANVTDWVETAGDECTFCNLKETQMHALRDCAWIRRRWQGCEVENVYKLGENRTPIAWMKEVWRVCSIEQIQKFTSILWFLWKERCNQKYNNHKLEEGDIIPRAMSWIDSYLAAQVSSLGSTVSGATLSDSRIHQWSPPPVGFVKLNSDAGVFQNGGVGFGCVLRDWRGAFVGATMKKEKGSCSPIEAEARALVIGLVEANRRNLSPLIVESDCQVLINKLRRREEDFTELGSWCDEILRLAKVNEGLSGSQVIWSFAGRKKNRVAHWLAHSGSVWDRQVVWTENPPLSLLVLLEEDLGRGPCNRG